MKVYDVGRPDPMRLETERSETWDMLKTTDLQSQIAELRRCLADAERELSKIKSSTE